MNNITSDRYQSIDLSSQQELDFSPRSAGSTKINKNRGQLRDRLSNRITHDFNKMSPEETRVHDILIMDEFLRKNQDIKLNISKHQRMKEALRSQEVRRTLVKIGSIFVGTPGYDWELGTFRSTPHPLSIIPINPEFHNAELAFIAIKSHRRSAFDLKKARGKRIIIITYLRCSAPHIYSMNGFPFLKLYSYKFYLTISDCYYIANSPFCSSSSSSSSILSAHPLFYEYGMYQCILEPEGHYSMKDNSYNRWSMDLSQNQSSFNNERTKPQSVFKMQQSKKNELGQDSTATTAKSCSRPTSRFNPGRTSAKRTIIASPPERRKKAQAGHPSQEVILSEIVQLEYQELGRQPTLRELYERFCPEDVLEIWSDLIWDEFTEPVEVTNNVCRSGHQGSDHESDTISHLCKSCEECMGFMLVQRLEVMT